MTQYSIQYSTRPARSVTFSLQWRHNEEDGVWTHRRLDCLLHRMFRRKSKKTSKLRVIGLCEGNPRWPVDCPHKVPVKRKMFPLDDVIIGTGHCILHSFALLHPWYGVVITSRIWICGRHILYNSPNRRPISKKLGHARAWGSLGLTLQQHHISSNHRQFDDSFNSQFI